LKLPYDSVKDFVPIAMVGRTAGLVLVVRSDFPAKTVPEFVALAKSAPGKYNYAHAGIGNVAHIAGELFKKMADIDLIGVPYQASNFGADVLGGQVNSGMLAVAGAQSLIQAGQLRGLALTGPKRTSSLPDIPTFQELGYKDMDLIGWFGLWAPAGTPRERVELLYRESAKALNTPEAIAFLDRLGMEPSVTSPAEFAKFVEMDIARQHRFLKWIGFQPN
jgi:tripartite-type tricarboxylate transporter receptor subunit TctC